MFLSVVFLFALVQAISLSWIQCRYPGSAPQEVYPLPMSAVSPADWSKLVPSATTDPTLANYLQSNFTFGGCNTSSLCLTPQSGKLVKEYAAVLLPLESRNSPKPGAVVTIRYTLRYVEGIDTFNLYGFGFRHIVFFGDYLSSKIAIGPSLSLASGSPQANFQYPGFDVAQPIASVQRYMANHTCDTTDAADDQTPATTCKFYTSPVAPAPLRDAQYNITLVITIRNNSIVLSAASVIAFGGLSQTTPVMLLNEALLPDRYSAVDVDIGAADKTKYIGIVSHRSPLVISAFRVTAVAPLCAGYTETATTTTLAVSSTASVVSSKSAPTTTIPERPLPTTQQPSIASVTTPLSTTLREPLPTSTESSTVATTMQQNLSTSDVTSLTNSEIAANSSTPASQQQVDSITASQIGGSNVALIASLVAVFVCLAVVVVVCTLRRQGIADAWRRWRMPAPRSNAENSRYELGKR